jgi:hypothetical protein
MLRRMRQENLERSRGELVHLWRANLSHTDGDGRVVAHVSHLCTFTIITMSLLMMMVTPEGLV